MALIVLIPNGWEFAKRARVAVLQGYSSSRPTLDWGLSSEEIQRWRTFALNRLKKYSPAFTGNPTDFAIRRDFFRFHDALFHFKPGSWRLDVKSKDVQACRPIPSQELHPLWRAKSLELTPLTSTSSESYLVILPNVHGSPYDTIDWWPPKPRRGLMSAYLLETKESGLLLVDPQTDEAWLFCHNLD